MYLEKQFDGKKYGGHVISSDFDYQGQRIWRVKYEDSDEEDLFDEELRPLLVEDPKIRAERFMLRRQRAINLYKHYPVLNTR